jgi:hypothetical protein
MKETMKETMNNQEQRVVPMGSRKYDFSGLSAEPLVNQKATNPCEYEAYHLPALVGGCNGPGEYAYGYGALVGLCEAHYASAPDPRRIPSDWNGNSETLLTVSF